jgi:hypothetical protein
MDGTDVEAVKRPGGVTAAAVVAIIGSLFMLVFGALIATVPSPPDQPGINLHAFGMAMAGSLWVLALVGFATAVGLLKLRPWARISVLVFAIFLTAMAALTIAFVALVPLPAPPGRDPKIMRTVLPGMIVIYSVPLLIGVWWLIQFTRPRTKAAFASNAPVGEPSRPLSISVIGWFYVIGGVAALIPVIARLPLFVAGFVLTDWKAGLGYMILGVGGAYLGWELLKLEERARKLLIAYVGVTTVHGILITVVPSLQTKMIALQNSIRPSSTPPVMQNQTLLAFSLVGGIAFATVIIWFLVKHKQAFTRTDPAPLD